MRVSWRSRGLSLGEYKVGFLGPPGTFTHLALGQLTTLPQDAEVSSFATIDQVIAAVEDRELDFGLVPIENSVEGEVTSTLDHLVFRTRHTLIREETVLEITFEAFKRPGFAAAPSETVISHRQALAQCKKYINRNNLTPQECDSTAQACEIVAASSDPTLVAIGSAKAGSLYRLESIAQHVEDYSGARTRFLLLSHTLSGSDQHGRKTAVVITPPDTRTGILAAMMIAFSDREVGVSSFSSRPLKTDLGAYCFFVTLEGSLGDRRVASALRAVLDTGASIKLLGSFRGHPGARVTAPFTQRPPGSISIQSEEGELRRFFSPPIAD